jgi:hypothetical protein
MLANHRGGVIINISSTPAISGNLRELLIQKPKQLDMEGETYWLTL